MKNVYISKPKPGHLHFWYISPLIIVEYLNKYFIIENTSKLKSKIH